MTSRSAWGTQVLQPVAPPFQQEVGKVTGRRRKSAEAHTLECLWASTGTAHCSLLWPTYLQGMLGNVVSLPEGRRWSQRHMACAQTHGGRLSSSQGHIHAFTWAHMSSDHHAQTTCKPHTEHRLTHMLARPLRLAAMWAYVPRSIKVHVCAHMHTHA